MASAVTGGRSEDGLAVLPLPETELPGLAEALASAERNAPRLLIAAGDVEYSQESRGFYSSGLYPKLNGTLSWNYLDERRSDGTNTQNDKLYYNLNISQPLYHWGALRANAKLGKLGYESAKLRLLSSSGALSNEIRSVYLGLITQKLGLRNARLEMDRAQRMFRLLEERIQQNLAATGELIPARMQLDERRIGLDRAEIGYRNARLAFGRLIGLDSEYPDEKVPTAIHEVPHATTAATELAEKWSDGGYMQALSVRLNELELAREKLNYAIVKTNLRPKFNLSSGLTQDRASYEANAPTVHSMYAGVTMNWNLFDGLATRAQKRASLARQRMLDRMLDQASADARVSAQRAADELKLSERSLALAEERWRYSQGGVAQAKADHEKGLLPADAIESAQLAYYGAEQAIMQARASYWMACAQFLSLMGADPVAQRLASISSR